MDAGAHCWCTWQAAPLNGAGKRWQGISTPTRHQSKAQDKTERNNRLGAVEVWRCSLVSTPGLKTSELYSSKDHLLPILIQCLPAGVLLSGDRVGARFSCAPPLAPAGLGDGPTPWLASWDMRKGLSTTF